MKIYSFFIVFIRSSPDIRRKCYKNTSNSRTKKENIKIYENRIFKYVLDYHNYFCFFMGFKSSKSNTKEAETNNNNNNKFKL